MRRWLKRTNPTIKKKKNFFLESHEKVCGFNLHHLQNKNRRFIYTAHHRISMQEKRECADCWRRKFREDAMSRMETLTFKGKIDALNYEVDRREEELNKLAEDANRLQAEIQELRIIAGDIALSREHKH